VFISLGTAEATSSRRGRAVERFAARVNAASSEAARLTPDGWLLQARLDKNAKLTKTIPHLRILNLHVRCTNRGKLIIRSPR
jgi:hypothetical protein